MPSTKYHYTKYGTVYWEDSEGLRVVKAGPTRLTTTNTTKALIDKARLKAISLECIEADSLEEALIMFKMLGVNDD